MISVVIPSKTSTNLFPCVDAIRELDPEVNVIVVDDGLNVAPADVKLIHGLKPFIFARNVNLGLSHAFGAGSNSVVILNDDAILKTPRGFSILAETAEMNPEFGLVASTCNNVGNRNQWPAKKLGLEPGVRLEPRMVCFVCVLIPKRTVLRVGLLDERFVGYGFEDDDYSRRVRNAGYGIAIVDDVFVDHGSLISTFRGAPTTPANLAENAKIFKQKWGVDNWGRK